MASGEGGSTGTGSAGTDRAVTKDPGTEAAGAGDPGTEDPGTGDPGTQGLSTGVLDLLGLLAYAELVAFFRLSEDAALAPSLSD